MLFPRGVLFLVMRWTRLASIRRQVKRSRARCKLDHHARERVEMMVNFLDEGVNQSPTNQQEGSQG
jgi:hypothetical protein